MNLKDFRQQYPQYNDLSDEKLAKGLHEKFYSDLPFEEFSQKIGYESPVASAPEEKSGFMDKVKTALSSTYNGLVSDDRTLQQKGLLNSAQPDSSKSAQSELPGSPIRKDYLDGLKQQQRINPNSVKQKAANDGGVGRAASFVDQTIQTRDELNQSTNAALSGDVKPQLPLDEYLAEKRTAKKQAWDAEFKTAFDDAMAQGIDRDTARLMAKKSADSFNAKRNNPDDYLLSNIQEKQNPRPEGMGDVAFNALARTASTTTAMNKAFVALALDSVGMDSTAEGVLQSAVESAETAGKYPAAIKDFTQIKSMSDVPTYILEGAIENSGMMLQSISAGGAGAIAAKGIAKDRISGLVKEKARAELQKRIAVGSAIGASSSSISAESGSIYQDIYSSTGKMRPGVAMMFGTVAGALDAYPAAKAVNTAMKQKIVGEIGDTLIQRYGVEGAKQIASEGGTEFLQTWIEKGAVSFIDGTPLLNKQNLIEATDAMLKGGAVGGVTHVAAQASNDTGRFRDYLARKQAEHQEKQSNSDAALAGISQAETVDDAIKLATAAIESPINKPLIDIPQGNESDSDLNSALSEAIQAADILGEDNVSQPNDVAELAAGTVESQPDLAEGSGADTVPVGGSGTVYAGQPDNATQPGQGNGNDIPVGAGSAGGDAVTPIAGEQIDNEWTAFAPESGTKGVPRAEMPQIKAEHRGPMVNFLNARDISHEADTVQASELKPTQAEFSLEKVAKAKSFEGGDRSILVSQDGHILDGHHQWLAKLEGDEPVDVIRLNAPIEQLINTVKEFPSATVAEGASSQPETAMKSESNPVAPSAITAPKVSQEKPNVTLPAESPVSADQVGDANDMINSGSGQVVVARIGSKNSKEQISVQRAGDKLIVLYNGDPLIDFETEQEVTVPIGATVDEIKKAVKASGQFNKQIVTFDKTYVPQVGAQIEASNPVELNNQPKVEVKPKNAREALDARFAANRKTLRAWMPDMDWATLGGRIIRDADNQVTGRTTWEPKDYDFDAIRSSVGISFPSMQKAVQKALDGKPLSKLETIAVNALVEFAEMNKPADITEAAGFESLTLEEEEALAQVERDINWNVLLAQVAVDDNVLASISARAQTYAEQFNQDVGDYLEQINEFERRNESNAGQTEPRKPGESAKSSRKPNQDQGNPDAEGKEQTQDSGNAAAEDLLGLVASLKKKYSKEIKKNVGVEVGVENGNITYISAAFLNESDAKKYGGQLSVDFKEKLAISRKGGRYEAFVNLPSYLTTDLLGDNTATAQAVADAERAKDAKRNAGDGNSEDFTLTGSNSEADQAAARGAQDLFSQPAKEEKPAESKITDLGEKIGGARKDTASSTGPKSKRITSDEDRPTWAKRYQITQVSDVIEDIGGKWVIRDTRDKDRLGMAKQVGGRDNFYETKEAAEAALPGLVVSIKHRAYATAKREDGTYGYEIYRSINDRKRVKIVDRVFDSRIEALEYMGEHAAEILGTNTTFGETDLPTPEITDRIGEARRAGDVGGQDFMDTFGLRAVEFGNWNNQIERQQLMNAAYDGLLDLAEVINIPPQAIGLDGELALAFGARGQGLSSAKAHYERDKVAMNLTKMNGAGSLAHEWFHALDHYLARLDGKASSKWEMDADGTRSLKANSNVSADFLSAGNSHKSKARPELIESYKNLIDTIFRKAATFVEDTEQADRFVARAKEQLAGNLDKLRAELSAQKDPKYWKRKNAPASAEQLIDFDTIAKQMLDGEGLDTDLRQIAGKSGGAKLRTTNDFLEKLSSLYQEVRGRSGFDATNRSGVLDRLRSDMSMYSTRLKMLKDAQKGEEKVKKVPTNFALNAKELDQGRGTDYWTTPHEMAARAFQGFVEDKIKDNGGISPFLNYGPENSGVLTPWGVNYPFPRGEERKIINQAITDFVDVLQTKETDKGTALFSRSTDSGMELSEVEELTAAITKGWANSPKIIVVEDMNDGRIRKAVREENDRQLSQGAAGQPEGFFDAGKVYIVSSEMNSADDVARVLMHETLGHYGLRGTFGDSLKPILKEIGLARRKDLIAKAKAYGLDIKNELDRMIAAEELLAEMAQTNPQIGFVKRAIAAIRTWLRDNVPYFKNIELTDAEIIRNILEPARNFVQRSQQVEGGAMATAFQRTNRKPSQADGDTYLTAALEYLARDPELFQRPLTESKSIYDIAKELDPGYRVEQLGKSMTNDRKANRAWEVFVPGSDARSGIIMTKENDVWIDVSRLQSGQDSGSAIYDMAAAFAHNNGKVLIGDPEGLTRKAFYRRNENMLSSALKYGTTRHLAPHLAQEIPDQYYTGHDAPWGKAQRKLNWIDGDDVNNIKELVYNSWSSAMDNMPELKDVIYNPESSDFEYTDGRPFTSKDSERIATGLAGQQNNPYRAGSSTQKRAALFNTFLRSEGGAGRRQLLGELVTQLSRDGLSPALKRVMYSRTKPQQGSLTPQWFGPEKSKLDNVIYTLQDKNIDLKRVTQNIKAAVGDISDRWNAYLQEELYHGRTAKRTQDFLKQELEPLITDMRMRGVGMADFEEYLWARHAEERNEQIASINPDMPDGGSGMTTQDARDYLGNLDAGAKKKYEALAKRIDAINAKSRQILVDYGLEATDTIAAWEGAYKHYVPLMREDMDTGFSGNGTGQGFSVKGNSTKRALGSGRAVVDIIANISQQREKNIIRGEKNRVATALVGLAKLNPNDDFWQVDTPPTIRDVSKVTGQVEERVDPNYKSRSNVVVARIPDKLGRIQERAVVFNEFDERAMRMAESLKNLDADQIGYVLGIVAKGTRYLASVNTQYNPIFGLVNLTRDVQGSLLNLSTTPLAGKKAEVAKHVGPALKGIYSDLRAVRKGKPVKNEWSDLWEEFQREGGQTGYRDQYRNAKERAEAIQNSLDPEWWQKTGLGKIVTAGGVLNVPEKILADKAVKPLFDWLSDYNEAMENATRLSVYKTALDNGISKQQAASLAKNISVNFNRKGQAGRVLGALYAFANASIQGTARIVETLAGPSGRKIITGGLILGAMQAVLMAMMDFDEDEPPEFVRDRNLIIPIGDKKYLTIPMPLGFNAIPNTGRILTEWALAGGEDTGKRMTHMVTMLLDVTNPIGGSGNLANIIMPSVGDPIVDLARNKDFTGRDISKRDFNSLDPTPGFTRAKDTASAIGNAVAKGINYMTGGTDFRPGAVSPTPDDIDYLIGQVAGGVGREVMKVENTATALLSGEELPTYKIPVVGKFYGDADGKTSQGGKFYNNLIIMNEHDNEIKGRIDAGRDVDAYLEEHPETQLISAAKASYKQVGKLRKRKNILKEEGASREEIREIDDQITEIMRTFNEEVKAVKSRVTQ